jgi:hypothetical protein
MHANATCGSPLDLIAAFAHLQECMVSKLALENPKKGPKSKKRKTPLKNKTDKEDEWEEEATTCGGIFVMDYLNGSQEEIPIAQLHFVLRGNTKAQQTAIQTARGVHCQHKMFKPGVNANACVLPSLDEMTHALLTTTPTFAMPSLTDVWVLVTTTDGQEMFRPVLHLRSANKLRHMNKFDSAIIERIAAAVWPTDLILQSEQRCLLVAREWYRVAIENECAKLYYTKDQKFPSSCAFTRFLQ